MIITTQCKKCGVAVKLDFGNITKEDATAAAGQLDRTPRECPGRHVELGGFRAMWQLDDAIHRAFDLGEGKEPEPIMTDLEFVQDLMSRGMDVIDGGCNTVPELGLRNIHEFPNLDHIGFGNFKNKTHLFLRWDSPRGTRFYEVAEAKKPQADYERSTVEACA